MSNLRSGPWSLKDPDDDAAFTELKNDVTELMIRVQKGTQNSPALTNESITNYVTNITTNASSSVSVAFSGTIISGAQAITESSDVTILWNATNNYAGSYSAATGIFTCPLAGRWLFYSQATLQYTPNAFGISVSFLESMSLKKNGSDVSLANSRLTLTPVVYTQAFPVSVGTIIDLVVGDEILVSVNWSDSAAGGSVSAIGNFYGTYLGT